MPPTALAVVGGIYIFNYLTALCFSAYSIVMSKNIANFAISNPAMRGASEEGQHREIGLPLAQQELGGSFYIRKAFT